MAQSDFDFYLRGVGGGANPVGGLDGEAQANASLSSPLTNHGVNCRRYKQAASSSGIANCWSARLNDARFVDIPSTKSIEVSARVRGRASVVPDPTGTWQSIGVSARTPNSGTSGGYHLMLGQVLDWRFGDAADNINGSIGDFKLRLCCRQPTGALSGTFTDVEISGTYTEDAWYAIKLEVIPNGSGDTIKVYTAPADDAEPTWTLLHTEEIDDADDCYNAPGATTRVGYTALSANVAGYGDTSNPAIGYIDCFEVRVSDV